MLRLAILGANGFIGSRLVEFFHLTASAEVIPIVRTFNGLARSTRFDLSWAVAPTGDVKTLEKALRGCEVVVDCTLGDSDTIERSANCTYLAAKQAAVRRLVYLSSAAVHGLAPPEGTNEDSQLTISQPFAYNRAKVRAERRLRRLRENHSTELVILRPGIVYGPRSRWVTEIASQLIHQQACLIDHGSAVCNCVYVDNLIGAIRLALTHPKADREAFFISDREKTTWLDFYSAFANALGIKLESIAEIEPAQATTKTQLVDIIRHAPFAKAVLPLIPSTLKRAAKAALTHETAAADVWLRQPAGPRLSAEMLALQQCRCYLGSQKAESLLGYQPEISFSEGCRRSLAWLEFSGFPVKKSSVGLHRSEVL